MNCIHKASIFSRLIIGYLAIFTFAVAVSIYAVVRLHRFNTITQEILTVDTLALDYEKRLTDALFSQVRYERKYLIMRDNTLYTRFLLAKNDFTVYLEKVRTVADTPDKKGFVVRIKNYHDRYEALFNRETGFIRGGRPYPQATYAKEKEKMVEAVVDEIKKMRMYYQQNIFDALKVLQTSGRAAARTIAMAAGVAVFTGILISLFITRSITRPLSAVIDKTRDIANGVLKSDLEIASPPEISELSKAFNLMCSKLRAIDTMKSDFFSVMSHELRTPLASIKEATSLLLEGVGGEASEKQKKLLTIIAEESNRLIGQVNSLLDLSKMEAGMMRFNFVRENIMPLIHKAAAEAELLATVKNIMLVVEHGQELLSVRMDGERMLQVLRNLIGNAVKFTPAGGQVKVSAGLADGNLMVEVSDTGPSIPQEKLTMIFEKYQQIPRVSSNQIKGTGLGLAIVKHIITAHGGRVWAESEQGRGSSFFFVLPA